VNGSAVTHVIMSLTFDDGPNSTNDGLLLDVLASKHVKVAFFVVGWNFARYNNAIGGLELIEREADILRKAYIQGLSAHIPSIITDLYNSVTKKCIWNFCSLIWPSR